MVRELDSVELNRNGLKDNYTERTIKEPIITNCLWVGLDELDEYKLPENLVKVTICLGLNFLNRFGMNEDILNFILDLEKKCADGVKLRIYENSVFTQSDWDFVIENIINNPSWKFSEYEFSVFNKNDITFNLDTDRKLFIAKNGDGTLSLKGKMAKIKYYGDMDKLKVEGEFEDIVDQYENPISHKVVDYDNLPDIYESLNERLRRLIW